LQEWGYPIGDRLRNFIQEYTGEELLGGNGPETEAFTGHPDKAKIDATLAKWLSCQISDDIALNQLLPMAIHYDYADLEGSELNDLNSTQLRELPFAQLVIKAWDAVLADASDELFEKYTSHEFFIGLERKTGLDENTLWQAVARKRRNEPEPEPGQSR
jgi:hypothetical protein